MNLIFYGAGAYAQKEMKKASVDMGTPVCFCDSDASKHGKELAGLPIMSLSEALERFAGGGGVRLFITVSEMNKPMISEYLMESGIDKECIVNFVPYDRYVGCVFLEKNLWTNATGCGGCRTQPDIIDGVFRLPQLYWKKNATMEVELNRYLEFRACLMERIRNKAATGCDMCKYKKEAVFPVDKTLSFVSYGIYARCQLSCSYCRTRVINTKNGILRENAKFIDAFDFGAFIKLLENRGLMTEETTVCLSGGEITIDPRKNAILDACEKYPLFVLTNAVKYSERIARMTSDKGSMLVSVDAGMKETYRKIKGADVFDKVFENIRKYIAGGTDVGLKYIFTSENDNLENVEGFIAKANNVGVKKINISVDIFRQGGISALTIAHMRKMRNLALEEKIDVAVSEYAFRQAEMDSIIC